MLRKLTMDLEMGTTHSILRKVFPDPRVALHNIIGGVYHDNYTDTYFVFVYREDLLTEQFVKYIEFSDGKTRKVVYYYTGFEAKMLMAMAKLIGAIQPDLMCGWNNRKFDTPYLFNRARKLNIYGGFCQRISPYGKVTETRDGFIEIPGIEIFDLMMGAKKILGQSIEASLDSVSKRILNIGKFEIMSIHQAWRTDIDTLVTYNLKDVELCVLLDNKIPIHQYFFEQMKLTGASYISLLVANYRICEQIIHYEKSQHPLFDHFMMETREKEENPKEFDGAITLTPEIGIYDMVAVHDLKMMYPLIMLAANMSPETLVRPEDVTPEMKCVNIHGVYFRTDFVGFIPRLIMKYISLRYAIEKEIDDFAKSYGSGFDKTEEFDTFMLKRLQVKGVINSWFGIFGYKNFILYNILLAESVTGLGRDQLNWSKKVAEEIFDILTRYGDTDSIFTDTPKHVADFKQIVMDYDTLDEETLAAHTKQIVEERLMVELKKVEAFHDKVALTITESYDEFALQYNITEHLFEMKFEKLYKRIFFARHKTQKRAAKKRYAGHIIFKDGKRMNKVEMAGFQLKRSDSAEVTKKCQTEVLSEIVFGDYNNMKTNVYTIVRDYYLSVINKQYEYPMVGIPRGFSKSLSAYNNRDYRWHAVYWTNKNLATNFGKGVKPLLVPLEYFPSPYNMTQTFDNKNPNHWVAFNSDHLLPEEMIERINWEVAANYTIANPLESITDSVGVPMNSVTSGMIRQSVRSNF